MVYSEGGGIDSLSFQLPPGKVWLLCGPNGAGKSTALRVAQRLHGLQSGTILVSGTSTDQLSVSDLRRAIGVISHTSQPLQRSIRDNLLLGISEAAPGSVKDASGQ